MRAPCCRASRAHARWCVLAACLLTHLAACGGDDAAEVDSDGASDAPIDASAQVDAKTQSDAASPDAIESFPQEAEPGELCDEDTRCLDESTCVFLEKDARVGFCAPYCDELRTSCGFFGSGVHAECALELDDGERACGFVCVLDHGDHVHNYDCPTTEHGRMRCERSPRDHGHHYCAPSP